MEGVVHCIQRAYPWAPQISPYLGELGHQFVVFVFFNFCTLITCLWCCVLILPIEYFWFDCNAENIKSFRVKSDLGPKIPTKLVSEPVLGFLSIFLISENFQINHPWWKISFQVICNLKKLKINCRVRFLYFLGSDSEVSWTNVWVKFTGWKFRGFCRPLMCLQCYWIG